MHRAWDGALSQIGHSGPNSYGTRDGEIEPVLGDAFGQPRDRIAESGRTASRQLPARRRRNSVVSSAITPPPAAEG